MLRPSAYSFLQSVRSLQKQQASVQQQQIALQQQQTAFQQEQTNHRQEQIAWQQDQIAWQQDQIAWQQQQTACLNQLLSMAHQNGGSITISSHDESESLRRITTTISSTTINPNKRTMTSVTAKKTWIGIGWYHYQSRIRASRSHPHSPNDLISQNDNDDKEIKRSYLPASWFSSRGFSFCTTRTWGIWHYSFRPIRVVSRSSRIFRAAHKGNIPLIIELLDKREATIYDTNKYGWNLLHISVHRRFSCSCSFLSTPSIVTFSG